MKMFSPFVIWKKLLNLLYIDKTILQLRQHCDDTLYSDKIIGN